MTHKERWNENKTRAFVTSYLNKPALWDVSAREYSQKVEKQKAYDTLMREFGLTLGEVRNKIRIYRTTYMQEKNKEAVMTNYVPRLSWYHDMKSTFKEGQVKSFSRSPAVKKDTKLIKNEKEIQISADNVQFEYEEIETEEASDPKNDQSAHIIIEPYEEEEDEELSSQEQDSWSKKTPETKVANTSNLPSSNELFLQSLKSTLDKLPDEKNMRARIKIQEVLYTIMYEKS